MAKREVLPEEHPAEEGGLFLASKSARPFFSTGCTLLDLALGGGWCEGQIIHLKGDTGTGKSLLAIEAGANFLRKFPQGTVIYNDRENAFDDGYVESLGIDQSRFENPAGLTMVEDVTRDVMSRMASLEASKNPKSQLYIVDSWDALTDLGEQSRDIDETSTYGMSKAKKGSEFGRRTTAGIDRIPFTIMIVSQLRASTNPKAGAVVSGGKWLRYYPTQSVELKWSAWLENTRQGHKRRFGQWLEVRVVKNRRGFPCAPIKIPLLSGYGIEDLMACTQFLHDEKAASLMFEGDTEKKLNEACQKFTRNVWKLHGDSGRYESELKTAREHTIQVWSDIVDQFTPQRKKYGPQ